MASTHFESLKSYKRRIQTDIDTAQPTEPQTGDFYYDSFKNRWAVYNNNQWFFAQASTTTSTSTSTTSTTTSTSTTSTSTSSSTSTSTSSSTSTSTTTTL